MSEQNQPTNHAQPQQGQQVKQSAPRTPVTEKSKPVPVGTSGTLFRVDN